MTSSVFPDINVWLALSFAGHSHHVSAMRWFESLRDDETLIFCRLTQLGLLRLLTQPAVMGNRVKTQMQAWQIYDAFLHDGNARLSSEPRTLDESFRRFASQDKASPQDWAESYLAAFAESWKIKLVTFDQALAARTQGSLLLER